MRWKAWMKLFFGVGTAYMDNYLAWFIFMENKKYDENSSWLIEVII